MRLVFHHESAGAQRTLQALAAVPQVAAYASQRMPHCDLLIEASGFSIHGTHKSSETADPGMTLDLSDTGFGDGGFWRMPGTRDDSREVGMRARRQSVFG